MKSNTFRFLASLFFSLLLCTAAHALHFHRAARSPHASPTVEREWTLAFELAFGNASPYNSRFPSLYDERLSYAARRAITKHVLDRIISIALREAGAKRIELDYRPGSYNDFPVMPSAQLIVRASDESVQRALNIIGYLAQQTAVIGSRKSGVGDRSALEIVEKSGRRLSERDALERFWRRLAVLSPKLGPGFSAIERQRRPGIYIIDSDGDWNAEDSGGFLQTIRAVSEEFGVETSVQSFRVDYVEVGNDWKTRPDGTAYLERLDEKVRDGLRRRLAGQYRPQVERWIEQAFRKYAPGVFK